MLRCKLKEEYKLEYDFFKRELVYETSYCRAGYLEFRPGSGVFKGSGNGNPKRCASGETIS